jgi:ribosomal protein S11
MTAIANKKHEGHKNKGNTADRFAPADFFVKATVNNIFVYYFNSKSKMISRRRGVGTGGV